MSPWNVLLITIDSLRADFVGCCGGDTGESERPTPCLDEFASKGVVFTTACAQAPYTWGSFAALFTSEYASTACTSRGILRTGFPTIAEVFAANGYETVGYHSNPFLSRVFGFDRGFETFDDSLFPWGKHLVPSRYYRLMSRFTRLVRREPYLPAEGINHKGLSWLRRGHRPFFLWLHYMDTHGPYQPGKGFAYLSKYRSERLWRKVNKTPERITAREHEELVSNYKKEIRYLDGKLGDFLKAYGSLGLLEETVVVLCADHGDSFNEHGTYSHPRLLYDELIRIPLLIRLPEAKQGKVAPNPVGLIDVFPTLVELLGLDRSEKSPVGRSLVPLIEGEVDAGTFEWVISEATPDEEYDHLCIRTREWKWIVDEKQRKHELYNLVKDPKELSNLASGKVDMAKKLDRLLQSHRPRLVEPSGSSGTGSIY